MRVPSDTTERSVTKILIDIIKNELELDDDYGKDLNENAIPCVIARDQNIQLGTTEKLQITVGLVNTPKVIANNNYKNYYVPGSSVPLDPPQEIQRLVTQENYQVDVYSANNDARDRNWEIITAINSIYARQQMEKYNFKIFKMPRSFLNTGIAEGGSNINRYTVVITCHVWYNKVKDITKVYDSFPTTVKVEHGASVDTFAEFNAQED
jgi:hypothetical protein